MLSRFVRIQLVAFLVIALLGVGYVSFAYLGVPRMLGYGQYRVTLQLPGAGGLYSGALVTLRGVEVGEVTAVRLTETGVAADLTLDQDVDLPSDVRAAIRSTSAIGEQYVDLTPGAASGAPLTDGATIPVSRVSMPAHTSDVLDGVEELLGSVPQDSLNTVIDESARAFKGTGQDLQTLLNSSRLLLNDATANLDSTVGLINDLEPVLSTQRRTSADIRSYMRDLAIFSGQIRANDKALRGTIGQTPALTTELSALFGQVRPTLPVLLANLTSVGQVVEIYLPNVEHTLVVFPAVVNNIRAATDSVLAFKPTINDPPPCTKGFSSEIRDPSDLRPIPAPTNSYCRAPKDSRILVRGARQNPCPNDPTRRSVNAAGCGLHFQTPQEAAAAAKAARYDPLTDFGDQDERDQVVHGIPYDRATGLLFTPGGHRFILGDSTRDGEVPASWKSLFLDPLRILTE